LVQSTFGATSRRCALGLRVRGMYTRSRLLLTSAWIETALPRADAGRRLRLSSVFGFFDFGFGFGFGFLARAGICVPLLIEK
jgi:hypothetical protein